MALDNDSTANRKGVWKSGAGKGRRTTKGRQLSDEALQEVRALLGDAPRRRDLLIEHLHLIQDAHGHLSAAHLAALDTHDVLEAAGMKMEVIPEPEVRRIKSIDFVASYANYYVCNGGVIAAQFGDREADAIAVDALKRQYPGREIVTLNVDALGEIGGGIHCATQQMPLVG